MEEIPLLQEILIILGLSVGVLLFCHRLKMPTIVGLLLTGVMSGPHGLALVGKVEEVQTLANLGIVLLLFTVGMEFSIKKILSLRKQFLIGGTLQILLTLFACAVFAHSFGRPIGESIFIGILISLSSTAITLRLLDEKGQTDSPHGKAAIAILIFQDVFAIPAMLATPLLSGTGEGMDSEFLQTFIKSALILTIAFIAAWYVVPRLLYYVAKTRSRELFLLALLTVCFSVAWLTQIAGLSLSLGAFLAGLIISESEYSHEAIGDIIPFQDLFTSFFFVSIGMLLNTEIVFQQPLLIFAIATAILLIKTSMATLATLALGMSLRASFLAAIALSQVGEFSFVIAKVGLDNGIGSNDYYQLFLAVSIFTMAVSPALIRSSSILVHWLMQLPLPQQMKLGFGGQQEEIKIFLNNHVVIIGFGVAGRNLARTLKAAKIPYIVLEMNAETVRRERAKGEPIHFGDATHESVLHFTHVSHARLVAVLINDPVAAIRIAKVVRQLNENTYILARTRYLQEAELHYQLGVNEVVADEFGSSLEVAFRVLQSCNVPADIIQEQLDQIRADGYEKKKSSSNKPLQRLEDLATELPEFIIRTFELSEMSPIAQKTLAEIQLRKQFGITVLQIKRGGNRLSEVEANTQLLPGDLISVMGHQGRLEEAKALFGAQVISDPVT